MGRSCGQNGMENHGTTGTAQKQFRVEVSQDMLDSTNNDPDFINAIITGDESWVYGYGPETKSQLSMKNRRKH